MIIIDELPFIFVEHQGFRRFMVICCPMFIIPSRRSIREDCFTLFLDGREKLKEFFKTTCDGRVSITTDGWTSVQNFNYIIINFRRIKIHKGVDVCEAIAGCLEEWGLKSIFTVTVDNASANDTAVTYLKDQLKNWGTSVMDGNYLHMRCVAHIVNLIVGVGLEEMGLSVRRVREAIRWVCGSPAREQYFRELADFKRIESKKNFSLDVPTRWNSTYIMLDTALIFERAFKVVCNLDPTFSADLKTKKWKSVVLGPPTDDDWKSVKNLTNYLKFFHELTLVASVGERAELEKYLTSEREEMEENGKPFDVLGWWKVNAFKCPILSEMANDILAVPISTVALESCFSTGGRVLDDFKSSLTPAIVEALICAEDWLRTSYASVPVEEGLEDQLEFERGNHLFMLTHFISYVLWLHTSITILISVFVDFQ
ncbi:Zinc finger BED domain-containing protein RICESLEEPER 2 [Linum grandiflorum]